MATDVIIRTCTDTVLGMICNGSSTFNDSVVTPSTVKKEKKPLMERIRSVRVFGLALFDLFITYFIFGMFDLAMRMHQIYINQVIYYLSILPSSVFIHLLIGKQTAMVKALYEEKFNVQKFILTVNLLFLLLFIVYQNIN